MAFAAARMIKDKKDQDQKQKRLVDDQAIANSNKVMWLLVFSYSLCILPFCLGFFWKKNTFSYHFGS